MKKPPPIYAISGGNHTNIQMQPEPPGEIFGSYVRTLLLGKHIGQSGTDGTAMRYEPRESAPFNRYVPKRNSGGIEISPAHLAKVDMPFPPLSKFPAPVPLVPPLSAVQRDTDAVAWCVPTPPTDDEKAIYDNRLFPKHHMLQRISIKYDNTPRGNMPHCSQLYMR